METGRSIPDVGIIESLCKELNISIGEFFAGEKIQEKEYKKEVKELLQKDAETSYEYSVETAVWEKVMENTEVKKYPEKELKETKENWRNKEKSNGRAGYAPYDHRFLCVHVPVCHGYHQLLKTET